MSHGWQSDPTDESKNGWRQRSGVEVCSAVVVALVVVVEQRSKPPQEEFSIDLLTPIPSRKLALQLRKPRERSRGTFVYQSLRGRPAEEHIWYNNEY